MKISGPILPKKMCKLILRVGWQSERIRTEQPKTADFPAYVAFFTNIIHTLSFGFYIKWI